MAFLYVIKSPTKREKKVGRQRILLQLQGVSSRICKEEIKLTLQQVQGFFTGIFIIPGIIMVV